jgi:hypothetical protein
MAIDYQALKAELLAGHPVTGAYDADDQIAADQLNAVNRQRNRTAMTGDEIFEATNQAEFEALDKGQGNTSDDYGHWLIFCARNELNPFSTANVNFVTDMFTAGSTTLANLNNLRREDVSRAVELGLGSPNAGDVGIARSLP